MSKLDKNQRIRTSKPRQVFDLSHDYLFTGTTGQLRPVSHDLLQPGDKVKGKFDFFLRTMPMSTAAMVDVDFLVDYWFVPLDLLWIRFGAWWSRTRSQFNVSEYDSSQLSPLPDISECPTMDISNIVAGISGTDSKSSYEMMRLFDDLGYSGLPFLNKSGFVKANVPESGGQVTFTYPEVYPWSLAAYQCIYQHWYRDEEREAFDPVAYSLDTHGEWDTYSPFLRLRYCNRQDDYFTSTKLSPLVSSINNDPNFLGDFSASLGNNAFLLEGLALDDDLEFSSNNGPNNLMNYGPTDDGGGNTSRAVNQLRALFAQEKLLHVMNMTHKDYDSQVLARLGYDVPNDVKHNVQHIGHDTVQLSIQEIMSMSNTFNGSTGSSLGDMAGQGKAISRNFKGFDFTAPTHGVLMTIWTCRVRPKYTASALRKDMMSSITDFFTPELDDLGMQPQYLYETTLVNNTDGGSVNYKDPYTIVGWNYRYEYLKRNINRASIAFMRGTDGRQFVPGGAPSYFGFNSYNQWSYVRVPLDYARMTNQSGAYRPEDDYYSRPHLDLYKVRPDELNNIMLTQYLDVPPRDGETSSPAEDWFNYPWLMYQRDPFIVDGRFSCKKVSAMSLYSMPKLV